MVVCSACDARRPTLFSSALSFFDKDVAELGEVGSTGREEKFGEEVGC